MKTYLKIKMEIYRKFNNNNEITVVTILFKIL